MPPQYPLVFGMVLFVGIVAFITYKFKLYEIKDWATAWKYLKIYLMWMGVGFHIYIFYIIATGI